MGEGGSERERCGRGWEREREKWVCVKGGDSQTDKERQTDRDRRRH